MQRARIGDYWPEGDDDSKWSYNTTGEDYTASMAEILLQFGAGVDRLQRPDRFLISNEDVVYNSTDNSVSFPLERQEVWLDLYK